MTHSMTARSLLVEIGQLLRSTPGPGATTGEVAAWYRRKADMLDYAANQAQDTQAGALRLHAARARHHAIQLTDPSATARSLRQLAPPTDTTQTPGTTGKAAA